MLAAWPEEDQGLPEITARPSNRAGRYFVLRSSSCSLSEICGRTSNKITRWPSKFTTPRSTPGTHTPRQWTQLRSPAISAARGTHPVGGGVPLLSRPVNHPAGWWMGMSLIGSRHDPEPGWDRLAALGYLRMRNPPRDNLARGPTGEALNCR